MKAAFESRAVQSVQYLETYVERLNATINVLRTAYTKASKVCRLYALDELADIYASKLVRFDLADNANFEAESVLLEIDCCRGGYHFAGTFFPVNRRLYSYLFRVQKNGLAESFYPKEYLAEVARRDLEKVASRIKARRLLLDQVLQRNPERKLPSLALRPDDFAKEELKLWRETLKETQLNEGIQALLVMDRIWQLREHLNEPIWLALVWEAGQAALAHENMEVSAASREAIRLRFRLGYVLLRMGKVEEGVQLYDEMLRRVMAYESYLKSEYNQVQSAIAYEQFKAGAKAALSGGLSGLSYGLQIIGTVVQVVPMGGVAGAPGVKIGISLGAFLGASMVDAVNPGLEASLQAYQYARYKSLETVRLFGDQPRALFLLFHEHERLEFHHQLGTAYEKMQRLQPAIHQYKNAIEIIESQRASLGRETTRLAFLQGKERIYEQLIPLLVQTGDAAGAFEYTERARSRNFVDLLASSAPKFRTISEVARYEQLRREQIEVDLAVEGTGLTRQEITSLRGAKRGVEVTGVTLAGHTEGINLENQQSSAGVPMPAFSAEFESLSAVQAATVGDISSHLEDHAALLAFFVGEDKTVVFLLQDGLVSAWIRPIGRLALQKQVEIFRGLIQKTPQSEAGEPASVEKAGREIYNVLLKDVVDGLHKEVVYLAPHGPLHYLPFAALHNGSRYLIDRFTLLNVSSGTVLTYLAKKNRATGGTTVVFANPDLGDPGLDLPFAEQEGQAVRLRQPQALLLTRKEAQERKVRELGPQASILHFATHGLFNHARPMESSLLLAGGDGDDGTMTTSEIFGLTLSARLVVLSACETGLSQIATGDEILGLTRAFMYAGTPQVIATLWEIDDQATSELMDQLYAELTKESPASALRAAQAILRKRYPHPFYWAGFVSYGIER